MARRTLFHFHTSISKTVSAVAIAALLSSPLAAFAQEAPTSTPDAATSSDNGAASPQSTDATPDATLSPSSPAASNTTAPGSDATAPSDPSNPTSQASAQSSVVGTSNDVQDLEAHAQNRPDYTAGVLVQSVPLALPPGRNGTQPDLSLTYNNNSGDDSNVFGYGWSISIPYIERLNKRGSDQLYTSSDYYSSLSGELGTTTASSTFVSRVEDGQFLKYTYSTTTNAWTVIDKSGTTYTFATTTEGRQDNPSDSSQMYKWMLTEQRDTNGNYVSYQYFKDAGQIYPSAVTYTNDATSTGTIRINFIRETRSDNATSSETAFAVKSNYRIKEINAQVNGTETVAYALAYSTGGNGHRSLLSSITQSGRDDTGATTTLPATAFTYQNTLKSWGPTLTDHVPVGSMDPSNGVHLADVNGDGLADLALTPSDDFTNNGDFTWTQASSTWTVPVDFRNAGTGVFDFNGDGLTDVYYATDSGTPQNQIFLNNGPNSTGWTLSSSTMPRALNGTGAQVVDVNGDGLADVLFSRTSPTDQHVWLNNGAGGWTLAPASWNIPMSFIDGNTPVYASRVVDINGDGLPDLVHNDQSGLVYLNNGNGWTYAASWTIPCLLNVAKGVVFADVNIDGLPDLVCYYDTGSGILNKVYLNNGDGTWTDDTANWSGYPRLDLVGSGAADLNGDGAVDMFRVDEASAVDSIWPHQGRRTDLLASVQTPTGATTTFTYKATPTYRNGSTILNPKFPYVVMTVNTVTTDDGFGNVGTTTYTYQDGWNYFTSQSDHKLAGFGTITQTDPAGNVTKSYFHQGNSSDSSHGEYQDSEAKIGKMYRQEKYDASSNLYQKTINKWDEYDSGNSAFVKLAQTVDFAYDGASTHKDKAEQYTYDNSNGNLTEKVKWGQVTGSDDGTFSDTGSDKFVIDTSYASSTGSNVTGKSYDETMTDQSANKVAEARHYFDGLSLGSVGSGNETKTETWKSGSSYASTTKTYNSYGLVTQSKDGRGNATTYVYDSNNLDVATSTNAAGQATNYLYNYQVGKPKQVTDPNGLIFQTVYDGIGRVTQDKQPDLTSTTTLVTKNQYTYTDSPLASSIQKTSYLNSASSTNTYTYLDGFGRTIQTRSQAKGNNTYAVKDNVYNTRGLLAQESLPYFASSTARSSATSTSALYSTYTYDPLSRVTQIINAIGTTTNSYLNWKVTTTDANGKQKDLYKDAFDNLITVVEHVAVTTATTSYAWNGNGYLTSITDANSNVRNFTYDGMGRRLTAEDLHASGDSSFGTWTYSYDDANNQTQTGDPKSQTVNFTYDAINRPLTEDYTGQSGTEVTYTYDSCTFGKGKLCVASTTSARASYTYDPLGAKASDTMTMTATSTSFATTYTNDRQGNQTQIIYPDGGQVAYAFNGAGLIDSIQEKESGTATTTVVRSFDYSPQNLPTVIVYGNGATTTNTYNASALYRLSNKVTALPGGGSHAQDLAYTYDALGNITQVIDNSNSATAKTVSYTYDDLSRLLTASTTNATTSPNYQQTYSYDALGNITSGPLGTYLYTGNTGSNYADPDALTAITVSSSTVSSGSAATSTIALDATSTSITNSFNGSVTKTWTHTVGGATSTILVLYADLWQDVGGSGTISSAKWNGGAFTKITAAVGGNMDAEVWYLVATTTGAKTMSVTTTGNTDAIKLAVASFSGVATTSPFDASTTATCAASCTNPTISKSGITGSDLVTATLSRYSTVNANTNRTSLYKDATGSTLGAASYQLATSSGTYSDTYTGSDPDDWGMVLAAFKAATTTGTGGTATTTSTTTLTYDNNGNLTGDGTYTYTWDYRNQLTQTATGTATTTYAYDHQGNRVKLTEASVTTYFPNPLYNTNGATTTKHIYAGSLLVATVENASSTSSSGGGGSTSTSTPTFVQDGIDTDSSSVVLGSPVTSGNLIVVGVTTFGQTIPSNTVTDNKGNTYTKVMEAINNSNGGDHVALFYAKNVTGGSSFTVSTGITGRTLAVHEYSGVSTTSPLDKVASSTGTSNAPNSGNVTTATSSELYFGVAWSAGDGDSWTAGSGYTTRESQTNNATAERLGSEDATISSASTTAAKFTTTTSQPWAIILATFQPSVTTSSTGTTTTASSTIRYVHTDQVNGSNIVTDASGNVVETLDYYPYGASRFDTKVGSYVGEKRKFAGTESDASSGLNYMQARYQNPSRGGFIAEDPMFLGDPKQQTLLNPQSLNSYSYANDNPITKSDPSGKSSIRSWLSDPLGSVAFTESIAGMAAYLSLTGRPASAELLMHSISLNPGSINAGNGSTLVNAITSNTYYQSQVEALLRAADSKALTSISNQTLPLNFTQGDAFTAFGHIDLKVNAQRNANGSWQVSVNGSDLYNINSLLDYTNNKLVSAGNNLAYLGQAQGTVSNFYTYLHFSQSLSAQSQRTAGDPVYGNSIGRFVGIFNVGSLSNSQHP